MSEGTYGVSIAGSDSTSYSGSGFALGMGGTSSGTLSGHENYGHFTISTLNDTATHLCALDGLQITQVPEPATVTLLFGMLLAAATLRRRC